MRDVSFRGLGDKVICKTLEGTPVTISAYPFSASTSKPQESAGGTPASTSGPRDPDAPDSISATDVSKDANAERASGSEAPGKKSGPNAGAIAGGVIGGLFALGLLGALAFFLRRRRGRAPGAHAQLEASHVPISKSRSSSPTSPVVYPSPGSAAAVAYEESRSAPPPPPPPPPPVAPAELLSREVDEDGVSVSSFDMNRPASQELSVPRLPVYNPGSDGAGSRAL